VKTVVPLTARSACDQPIARAPEWTLGTVVAAAGLIAPVLCDRHGTNAEQNGDGPAIDGDTPSVLGLTG